MLGLLSETIQTSKQWMREHVNDGYVQAHAAKVIVCARVANCWKSPRATNCSSRACGIDLGAAPGGWSQVAQAQVGTRGLVVAFETLEMAPPPGVKFVQGDFRGDAAISMLEQALSGREGRPCIKRYVAQYQRHQYERSAGRVMDPGASWHLNLQILAPETGRQFAGQSVPGLWISRVFSNHA